VLLTGLPVLGMAAGGWPELSLAVLVMTAIALAAASANTLNAYIERDLDKLVLVTPYDSSITRNSLPLFPVSRLIKDCCDSWRLD
jgi:protoheme IX farnesyltransferase